MVNGTFLPADFDEDQNVDYDVATWQSAFDASSTAAAIQSVPEPARLALLVAAIPFAASLVRRRRLFTEASCGWATHVQEHGLPAPASSVFGRHVIRQP